MVQVTNFALDADEKTLEQFRACCTQDFVVAASLMPDAHAGYVAPIGSVLVTKDYVVPAWVGYDIGCGLISGKFVGDNLLARCKEHAIEIFEEVQNTVPMGMGKVNHIAAVSEKTKLDFKTLLESFKKGPIDKAISDFIYKKALSHLGSLGDGNHFIELGEVDGELWLSIHSGSRGIGHHVAEKYMKKVAGSEKGFEATFPIAVASELGQEYINILNFGLEFALLNRLEMAYKVEAALKKVLGDDTINFELWTNKNHNHALFENGYYIHRKGATPAKKDERGVIPGTMRDGCFLVKGLGNTEFLESSSHGAGRKMSRRQAKSTISMDDFKSSMSGIIGTIKQATLDEAPQAYKDIFSVMSAQKKSVAIVKHIIPIINWKGSVANEMYMKKKKR